MVENFSDRLAENRDKADKIARDSERVNSIEGALVESIGLSFHTVMKHAVQPYIAKLFRPNEARVQGYECGKDTLARLNDEMDKAYADC